MLHHLLVLFPGCDFVVNRVDGAVTVVRKCVKAIQETLVFNMDYFDWCISDFTRLLMFWKVCVYHVKISDGDVRRAAKVNVHDVSNRHECHFARFSWLITSIKPAACV